jgi:hypothetical protein
MENSCPSLQSSLGWTKQSGSGRKTYEYKQELDGFFKGDPIVKPQDETALLPKEVTHDDITKQHQKIVEIDFLQSTVTRSILMYFPFIVLA